VVNNLYTETWQLETFWCLKNVHARYASIVHRFDIAIFLHVPQIADFGMSRDLLNENYYITSGGKIPVKWTAPEVADDFANINLFTTCRPYTSENFQYSVIYGVMVVCYMRYGAWDTNHLKERVV